jgi:hypothetical protein
MQADPRDAHSVFDSAACWRMRAEEVRRLADDTSDAAVRAMMFRIAVEYDRCADLAEERESSGSNSNVIP